MLLVGSRVSEGPRRWLHRAVTSSRQDIPHNRRDSLASLTSTLPGTPPFPGEWLMAVRMTFDIACLSGAFVLISAVLFGLL